MKRILVVEDNVDLAYGLRNNLEIEGYEVEVAHDGTAGLRAARLQHFDLVVLDLMLPQMHGFLVLRSLREEGFDKPILILTARGEESDKVRGLKLGADDYITKPFGLLELLARVEALVRRHGRARAEVEPAIIRFGDVEIEEATRTVRRGEAEMELTPKEYELLVTLARHRGAVVSRVELMRQVWGYSDAVISRTVDTHIAELRRKLEGDPSHPRHIITARKVGYRLRT